MVTACLRGENERETRKLMMISFPFQIDVTRCNMLPISHHTNIYVYICR